MVNTIQTCVKIMRTGIIYLYHKAPKKYDLSFLSKHNKKLNETKEINLSPRIRRRLLRNQLTSSRKPNYGRLALKTFEHLPRLKYVLIVGVLYYGFVKIKKMIEDGKTWVTNLLNFSWFPRPDLGQIKSGVTSSLPAKETIYGWGTSIASFTKAWIPKPDVGKIINAVYSYIPKKETIYDKTTGWGSDIVNFTKAWIPKPDVGKIMNGVSSYIPKKETIYDTTKVVTSGVISGVSWTYTKVRSLFGGTKEE